MPHDRFDEDRSDNDPTDELPILLETAVPDPGARAPSTVVGDDDTGEFTVRRPTAAHFAAHPSDIEALQQDLESRAARIATLESETERLAERRIEIDRDVAAKNATINALNAAVAELQTALDERNAAARRLEVELSNRDTRLNGLLDDLDRQRTAAAALTADLETARREAQITAVELAAVRSEQAKAALASPPQNEAQALREELATLADYVTNRRTWWDELTARAATQAARIAELELRLTPPAATEASLGAAPASTSTGAAPLPASAATDEVTHEVVPRMESDLENQRAEFAAQRRSLHEQNTRLEAAGVELEALRTQLVNAHNEIERARADGAQLERALLDKERALAAREERIASLQVELEQNLGALQKVGSMSLPADLADERLVERLRRADRKAAAQTPALVCLTGASPRAYALTKKAMLIGRSSQCDVQILTHFVSREHARLTIGDDRVVVEDLGSTNGVFVNSMRIERQELRHGDLVTVGETQFRFLETMAH